MTRAEAILKSINEGNVPGTKFVEITEKPTRQEISDGWTDFVTYKGINVFDAVYDKPAIPEACEKVVLSSYKSDGVRPNDFQECYLGYSPSRDLFYMGFEGGYTIYGDEDDEDAQDEDTSFWVLVSFALDEKTGHGSLFKKSDEGYETFYKNYEKNAKQAAPDMIDIRLD